MILSLYRVRLGTDPDKLLRVFLAGHTQCLQTARHQYRTVFTSHLHTLRIKKQKDILVRSFFSGNPCLLRATGRAICTSQSNINN